MFCINTPETLRVFREKFPGVSERLVTTQKWHLGIICAGIARPVGEQKRKNYVAGTAGEPNAQEQKGENKKKYSPIYGGA